METMRLLCISDGRRTIPHLQVNYIYAMKKWFDIVIYGPNEYELNGPSISPLKFSDKLNIIDLCKEFKPEMVILPEYSVVIPLLSFLGNLERVKSIPVVSIEDYIFSDTFWKGEDRQWHVKNGIDYVISRAPFHENVFSVPSVWLPWAADNMFSDIKSDWYTRYDKALYVGEGIYSKNIFYTTRKKAVYILESNGLLDSFRTHKLEFYKEKLSKYRYFLSDTWYTLGMPPCKTFEAMAAGCATLSPSFVWERDLFGNNNCLIKYDKDCDNLLSRVRDCINNPEQSKAIAELGQKIVLKEHMLSNRIEELKDILTDILNKKEIRKKWGY